ncbi:g1143 [Coccomyxa elongata]
MADSATGECANPAGPMPPRLQAMATDIMQMYKTKSAEEQAAIVKKYYRQDARFVDPLMDVGTPREIHLAFISLIKLFKSIDMEQKSLTWSPQPQGLPQGLQASDVQQVLLNNRQVYHTSMKAIDLDVNTYLTIDPKSGLIIKHEDRWNNSGFRFPGFLKKPNGIFTSSIFKLIGWGRQVDKAAGAAK